MDEPKESKMLNASAHQKPLTCTPLKKFAAIITIKALITRRKTPRVTNVTGIVRITRMGFTIAFKIANTKAKSAAVFISAILTPERILGSR